MIPVKSFDYPHAHVDGRWGSLCTRGILIALLAAILPLAEASQPDPMCVGSVYDGADLDDVVAAVAAATAVVVRTVSLPPDPTVALGQVVLVTDGVLLPRPCAPTRPPRAPPAFTNLDTA